MPKTRWILRCAWLWLCVLVAALSAQAENTNRSDAPFIVDSWSTKEGLPQSSVISVIQTRDGYLWLGTLNGLVRFDGTKFTIFNDHNTPGLNSDRIVYLLEDSRTNLWIGTDTAGVALLSDGKIQNFTIGRGGHEGRLVSACEDADGGVWLYTADARLARYRGGKMEILDFHFTPLANCRMVVAEKSGLLWVGESSPQYTAMFSIQPANLHPPAIPIDQILQAERLDFLLASQRGGTWRLINGRVQKWGHAQLEKDFGAFPWTNAVVTSACEDNAGNLIVGTLGAGIFWFDPEGHFQRVSKEQGLSSDYVLSLCMDAGGNLWAGTDGDGLNRIKRKIFSSPSDLRPLAVQSIAEDAQGGLWTAFNGQGISYWGTNATQDFGPGQGLPDPNAWTVLVDRQQRIWVGTRFGGLFQFQTNHFQPAPGAEILGARIFALFQAHNGWLWAGTQNGLARWDGQAWKMFTTQDGLSENIVRAIAEDADGNLWIGTENQGLNFFKGGKFTAYQMSDAGLPGNGISCLYIDRDGALWVGTSGHGLARFEHDKWTRYSTDDGLASDSISYLVEDAAGDLWLGSNLGLMRIAKKSLNDFASGATNVIPCRTYVETDGLPTRECTGGSQPAAIRARDGKLWFPTTKGLVSVNPAELKANLQPPLVKIESVLVDGQRQNTNPLYSAWSPAIVIPPGHEQLEIDYTALNFSAPELVRFQCWLEGHEARPTDVGSERVARYPKLPPGNYRFHVTACNEDGVWNKTGSVLAVTVQPWFWQTRWFLITMIACLLAAVVGVVRYLSTQKLRREVALFKQQEAVEKERSRIARDLHDQLGANLTQVALLGELAEADKHLPDEIESHAQQIYQTARETTRALDEIVWAANPSNDTLEGLANYACKYAQDYFALAGLRYRADLPAQLPAVTIPPDIRHHAFLAFKEAVNNVVKHAHASEAWIRLRLHPGSFMLEIEDNGRGTGDLDPASTRNGLKNMSKRMEDIGGQFSITAGANGGTLVRLTVPVKLE
jgi:ligand-binding sensor domain-containing protein/signal transduction histidine kinase